MSCSSKDVCAFCGQEGKEADEFRYGKFLKKQNLSLHNFCMLFASGLNQRGKSAREGVLGFLTEDIKKELIRGQRLRCVYCKLVGATIGCSVRKCRRKFHMPCGLKNDSLHQFFGAYISFCAEHRPKQSSCSDRLSFHDKTNNRCPICIEVIESRVSNQTLRAPCCKNTWFHRTCIQAQALSAGYFFKCPLCVNKRQFQVEMMTYGIHIPEQDASWEREEHAYEELLHRHNRCDHPECQSPKGVAYNKDGSIWQIVLCNACGSQGCHIACGQLKFSEPYFECEECKTITAALYKKKMKSSRPKSTLKRSAVEVDVNEPSSSDDHDDHSAVSESLNISREMSVKRIRSVCSAVLQNAHASMSAEPARSEEDVTYKEDMFVLEKESTDEEEDDENDITDEDIKDDDEHNSLLSFDLNLKSRRIDNELEDVDVEAMDDSSIDSVYSSSDEIIVCDSDSETVHRRSSFSKFPVPTLAQSSSIGDNIEVSCDASNNQHTSVPFIIYDVDNDSSPERCLSYTPPPLEDLDAENDAPWLLTE